MNWDNEKQHIVQGLWPDHSASAIADEVSSRYREPCNRSMIMGIVHRMHLERKGAGRLPKVNTRTAAHRARQKKVKIILSPPPAKFAYWDHDAPLNMRPCVIAELDGGRCHWPLGPVNEIAVLFCGATPAEGWPYCAHHTRMAYVRDRRAAA